MSKGIILTLDAILAIIVSTIMFFYIFTTLFQINYSAKRDLLLTKIGQDILTSLEKNGTLQLETTNNRTVELREILNSLPPNICSTIEIYNPQNQIVLIFEKAGCNCTTDYSTNVRSFVLVSSGVMNSYFAKSRVCYK